MKLVVRGTADFEHTVHGITLEKGFIPTLNTLSEEEQTSFKIPEIEPAIWFKILVVDTVTVDCQTRSVTWFSTKDPTDTVANNPLLRNKRPVKRISQSTFLLSDDHTQQSSNDLDDAFEETQQIIQRFQNRTKSNSNKVVNMQTLTFYEELFSILYRFILPSITFTKDDLAELKAALEYQLLTISKQDEAITKTQRSIELLEKSQRSSREVYYAEISRRKDGSSLNFPAEIAMVLHNHIQEDLSQYSQQLAEAQTEVNMAKQALRDGDAGSLRDSESSHSDSSNMEARESIAGSSSWPRLADSAVEHVQHKVMLAREKRDQIFERYKLILQIRETLSEYVCDRVIIRKNSKKKITKRQVIRSKLKKVTSSNKKPKLQRDKNYLGLENERKERFSNIAHLVEEKVQMISVKEGIKCAIEELKTEKVAFGVNFDHAGSYRSTDVLRKRGAIPQNWLSLNEQISRAIEDTSSHVHKLHQLGCQRINIQCNMFHKLHRKYLLSSASEARMASSHQARDDISLDSTATDGVSESAHSASHTSSSCSVSSGDSATRLDLLRSKTDRHTANDQTKSRHRETFLYAESESDGLEALICVTRRNRGDEDEMGSEYTCASDNDPRYNSLIAVDNESLAEPQVDEEMSDVVIVHDTSPLYAHAALERLNTTIKQQMNEVSVALQHALGRTSQPDYQKIWASYERIYFTEVMHSLEQLYTLAYANVLQGLESSLPRLTPYALAMDNKVILQLFEDLPEAGEFKKDKIPVIYEAPPNQECSEKVLANSELNRGENQALGTQSSKCNKIKSTNAPSDSESQEVEVSDCDSHANTTIDLKSEHAGMLHVLSECSILSSDSDSIGPREDQSDNTSCTTVSHTTGSGSSLAEQNTRTMNSSHGVGGEMSLDEPCTDSQGSADLEIIENDPIGGSSHPYSTSKPAVEMRRRPTAQADRSTRALRRHNIHSVPVLGHVSPPSVPASRGQEMLSTAEEMTGTEYHQHTSSTDVNMNLAEQLIQNTTSGLLKKELVRATSFKPANCRKPAKLSPSDDMPLQDLHANTDGKEQGEVMLQAHTDACDLDLDSTMNTTLDDSFTSNKATHRSKYANVLEQINLDYARQVEKNIHIYYPVSVNTWSHERSTWPLVGKDEPIEFASDAMQFQKSRRNNLEESTTFTSHASLYVSRPDILSLTSQHSLDVADLLVRKTVRMQPQYLEQMSSVVKQLKALCHESTPTNKLQYAFKALHALGVQVKSFHSKLGSSQCTAPSADDLTDFLVVLLCNCDIELVKSLYTNVQIMRDHIPESLETGPYGFALMQLTICLHFLQERIVMQRGLMDNDGDRVSDVQPWPHAGYAGV